MTTTEALITRLAGSTRAVPRHAAALRLTGALVVGACGALALLTLSLGDPFLGTDELGVLDYGVKLAFTFATTLIAASFLLRAARPEAKVTAGTLWIAAPLVVLAAFALLELTRVPSDARQAFVMGTTWRTCLASVVIFAMPVFAALLVALRRLAPTNLARAGTLAGLAAGSTSAFVYAFHCLETSPAFLLVWYGLGIATTGLIGKFLGRILLRW